MRWVTTERVQVDRLASAWLIRRFIDAEASFGFVPPGTEAAVVTDGTPFYLPGAVLRRDADGSTFATIVRYYQLADAHPALVELGLLIRAVDAVHGPVAFRSAALRDVLPADAPLETAGLQLVLHGVRLMSMDDDSAITAAVVVLDAVYSALQARHQPTTAA